ncbi:MAG: aminotransferase class V-fold PLP-dependent enzyme [Planctomycetaceae bacterium]
MIHLDDQPNPLPNASDRRHHWQLDPTLVYFNHGSFGATPRVVLAEQRRLQDALECDPIEFLAPERSLEPKLDQVRRVIATLVGADPAEIAFVDNATDGVNAVLRSFPLSRGDQVVVTDHGYNACNNAARFAAQARGAELRIANVPFPLADAQEVVDAIEAVFTSRTRLLLVDHVTSATGLVFPIQAIVDAAHRRNIRVLVDGAHAPGMVPLNLNELGADYYTANHHKWLCGPKVSGFLWTRPEWQSEVRPTTISHAANRARPRRSQYTAEFDWQGTFDPTPLLSVPAAIDFLNSLYPGGLPELMAANRTLALEGRACLLRGLDWSEPAPQSMIGSLVTLPLPLADGGSPGRDGGGDGGLQQRLRERYRIELPIFEGLTPGSPLLRISLQAYNDLEQVQHLVEALDEELPKLTNRSCESMPKRSRS